MRRAIALAVVLAACSARSGTGEASLDPRRYVPTTPGDRFRERVEPGGRFEHSGVTAVDARGRAVVLGTDRVVLSLVEKRDDGVWIVSPAGERLIPMITAPITRGHVTRYRIAMDHELHGDCELTVTATDVRARVAGRPLAACVDQRRRCVLPAGDRLARPTTLVEEETLCPDVGRIRHRFEASPPLPFEGMPSELSTTLVSFHVSGGAAIDPHTSTADRLIVLPSDVAAACGSMPTATELRASATTPSPRALPGFATPPDARPSDVLLGFAMRDGPLTIEARTGAPSELDAYLRGPGGGRIGFTSGGTLVRITPPPSCRDAARLEPLVRSMLD